MNTTIPMRLFVLFTAIFVSATTNIADEPAPPKLVPSNSASGPSDDRRERLADYLTHCDFVGRYTTDGKTDKLPKPERYTIKSCKALEEDEMYELAVRIHYGSVDSEVPMKVRIVFADQTPVITLDQMWIPGMGTFDARVMIRRDRYAGTWQHDDHGGHLFGVIEQHATEDDTNADASE